MWRINTAIEGDVTFMKTVVFLNIVIHVSKVSHGWM